MNPNQQNLKHQTYKTVQQKTERQDLIGKKMQTIASSKNQTHKTLLTPNKSNTKELLRRSNSQPSIPPPNQAHRAAEGGGATRAPKTDQANNLRQKMKAWEKTLTPQNPGPPILAVASGKGGVGKSNIAVNIASQLSASGKRVLLFDADFGLGNTDILLGVSPKITLSDALINNIPLHEIAHHLDNGVTLIPAGSGQSNLANANPLILEGFLFEMERFSHKFDWVIIDTGAGIGERTINTLLIADQLVIVTTPDPTSITDSYATIKAVSRLDRSKKFKMIVNMSQNTKQGEAVFNQINFVTKKYLSLSLDYCATIPLDKRVPEAVRKQKPFIECFPGSPASIALSQMAKKLTGHQKDGQKKSQLRAFLKFFTGVPVGKIHNEGVA